MKNILLYLTYKYNGDARKIHKAIIDKEKIDNMMQLNEKILDIEIKGISYLTVFDENFPSELKEFPTSPLLIFYQGNIELLKSQKICLTGDLENIQVLTNINLSIKDLVKKYVLITTNFKNLDKQIIEKWRKANGKIIHLLPHGLLYNKDEKIYPNELYLSIYPPESHPEKTRFKERNILISWLAKFLIIYSSKEKSGIINLASCFTDMGKEVYCYPGLNYDDGNNYLIKNGANLITHVGDVLYY
ncbi:DNA-processing protein DprA [Mycoplasmopsis columbina]|uniref:DNA processing protein smf n=1 Tax=Mycoplasmopsis columbina SF7 TaxID=1037410 RepID=F9UKD1_9BACT|nr:DNA-processing protein DprA [Mycoplasmopsis columbina]EGV00136.1 DNA processing protein smf [Mycoplasmopsis columbina SF7]VEU77033.1 DNA processing protein [Mycoplasmopsis columbina]